MAKKQVTSYSVSNDVDFGEMAVDAHIERDLWWILLLRGIVLVALGMMALVWPGITLVVLAEIFAIWLLVVGSIDVIVGVRSVHTLQSWFLKVVLGVLEIAVGVYLFHQGIAIKLLTLVMAIGLFFIFQGIVEIVGYFRTSKDVGRNAWLIVGGLISVAAGMIILRQPVTGAIAFTWVLGFYGLLGGAIAIAASLSMRPRKSK